MTEQSIQTTSKVIKQIYEHFIDLPENPQYTLMTVWTLGSFMFGDFDSYPYLYFSGTKQSGKSKVLTVMKNLCPQAWLTVSMTLAVAFRLADTKKATLLFDELETINKEEKSELKQMIYTGYKKCATVPRVKDPKTKEIIDYDVYCPKAFCSINRPDSVMADRCIVIDMKRSLNKEIMNRNIPPETFSISGNLVTWTGLREIIQEHIDKSKPEILKNYKELDDDIIVGRDWELWQPVLSVAKEINDDWYNELRNFAIRLMNANKEDESVTLEAKLLHIISEHSKDNKFWIKNKDIHFQLNETVEWGWVYPNKIGAIMKNLGFKLRHTKDGNSYYIEREKLIDIANRLGIDLSEGGEANEGSTGVVSKEENKSLIAYSLPPSPSSPTSP